MSDIFLLLLCTLQIQISGKSASLAQKIYSYQKAIKKQNLKLSKVKLLDVKFCAVTKLDIQYNKVSTRVASKEDYRS